MGSQLEFLQNCARMDRLSHAYIFSGNDHAAKQRTAIDFVQFLQCAMKGSPCGTCSSCHAVERGMHADVKMVRSLSEHPPRKAEITIAQMRDLASFLSLGAWNSSHKIVMIEGAEGMNQEAQSAFLKLLEEPKGKTVFFLFTPHADLLLETIQSRCQELSFYAFPGGVQEETKESMLLNIGDLAVYERFEIAKQLADNPEQITGELSWLLAKARKALLESLRSSNPGSGMIKAKDTIERIQQTMRILEATNANVRLGLEQLFLSL